MTAFSCALQGLGALFFVWAMSPSRLHKQLTERSFELRLDATGVAHSYDGVVMGAAWSAVSALRASEDGLVLEWARSRTSDAKRDACRSPALWADVIAQAERFRAHPATVHPPRPLTATWPFDPVLAAQRSESALGGLWWVAGLCGLMALSDVVQQAGLAAPVLGWLCSTAASVAALRLMTTQRARAEAAELARLDGEPVRLIVDEAGVWWQVEDSWVAAPWSAVRSLAWDEQVVAVHLANGFQYRVPLAVLSEELRASMRAWAPSPPAAVAEAPPPRAEPLTVDQGPWAPPRG